MRKSIIAGLTLAAALTAFAGQSQAHDPAQEPVKKHRTLHRPVYVPPPVRAAETGNTQFRIPAHPVVRDCVHVFFPQCARGYDGLNDGTFGRY
jgi:hypothetical protein